MIYEVKDLDEAILADSKLNDENFRTVFPIKFGMKLECNSNLFKNIINTELIKDRYTLNVLKLSDENYSIYFGKKDKDKFINWMN